MGQSRRNSTVERLNVPVSVRLSPRDYVRWRRMLEFTGEGVGEALRRATELWVERQILERGCRGPRRVITHGSAGRRHVKALVTRRHAAAIDAVAQAAGISRSHAVRLAIREAVDEAIGPVTSHVSLLILED